MRDLFWYTVFLIILIPIYISIAPLKSEVNCDAFEK